MFKIIGLMLIGYGGMGLVAFLGGHTASATEYGCDQSVMLCVGVLSLIFGKA